MRKAKKALAQHFGLRLKDVKHYADDYADEFVLMFHNAEVQVECVSFESAISNTADFNNGSIEKALKDITTHTIGVYTRMIDGEHYFRIL